MIEIINLNGKIYVSYFGLIITWDEYKEMLNAQE